MLFNSYEFIFAFLPATLLVFFLLGHRGAHRAAGWWLTGASLFFYGWWNPQYLLLILGSTVWNYLLGLLIARPISEGVPQGSRGFLTTGIIGNLALLGYYKYSHFIVENAGALLRAGWSFEALALPLAISFFTFTQIAYLVDAYRGETRAHDFGRYALFVTFFPHLIAGPIVLFRALMPQFDRPETWRFQWANMAGGATLFAWGLAKKVCIADALSPIASGVFIQAADGPQGLFIAWVGALAYTFQLYFDFSGYSDMAIGIARMFNIEFPLNFYSPYKAGSIVEFWRCWHITLSQFLRDHVYIPLGGNRGGPARRYVNLFATMLLGGLWHGAGWTFIAWGALHGAYLCINHGWSAVAGRAAWLRSAPARWVGGAITFLAVVIGWVVFRAGSLADAGQMLASMAGARGLAIPSQAQPQLAPYLSWFQPAWIEAPFKMQSLWILAAAAAIAFLAPNTEQLFRLAQARAGTDPAVLHPARWLPSQGLAVATGILLALGIFRLSNVTEFLYFQF